MSQVFLAFVALVAIVCEKVIAYYIPRRPNLFREMEELKNSMVLLEEAHAEVQSELTALRMTGLKR